MNIERKKDSEKFGKTLLTIDNVRVSLGSEKILDGISFDLKSGEALALIGPNGIGKTTLLRIILGEELPDSGSVSFAKGMKVGYVPQYLGEIKLEEKATVIDFFYKGKGLDLIKSEMGVIEKKLSKSKYSEELLSKYGELQNSFEIHGGWKIENEARKALNGIGLSEVDFNQQVTTLSGGQKTKLFITQAVVSNPDLLILDEPTNYLDSKSVSWFGEYLHNYRGAILVVSHNPQFINPFISGVIELNPNNRKSEEYKGNYDDYLKQREERKLTYERTKSNLEKEIKRQKKIVEHLRGGVRASTAKSREKKLERFENISKTLKPEAKKSKEVNIHFEILRESGKDVLLAKGLKKRFGLLQLDYSKISLSIQRGESIIILGPEGAGKSTFLKMICGDLPPDEGKVIYGTNVNVGYYREEHENLNNQNTVFDELRENGDDIPESRLRAVLAHFLFPGENIYKRVGILSQGEKSRLALAKLVLGHHNFLVLDEPTNHLDMASKHRLVEALWGFGGTLLVVSHDERFINQLGFDKEIIFPQGKIKYLK